MASWIASLLSFLWPSKASSDLATSRKIVEALPLQPSTKNFTLALCDPDHPKSVVYILATVLLSERSASDARDLIKNVNPRAVVAQVGVDALEIIRLEELNSVNSKSLEIFPTSPMHVMQESFHDGNSLVKYMKMAEAEVVRAIFGTTFIGHVAAAKEAAAELKCSFYYLEGPPMPLTPSEDDDHPGIDFKTKADIPSVGSSAIGVASLLGGSFSFLATRKALEISQSKVISSHAISSVQNSLAMAFSSARIGEGSTEDSSEKNIEYECPAFAQSFYPLLADLHKVYKDLPGMSFALERTKKLLRDVDKGKDVDQSELALSQCFRLAVEGLRVAINVTAMSSLKLEKPDSDSSHFDDLSYEDKCHVLLAQALKQQAQQSQVVVAILDAGSVEGIRKHWMIPVSDDVAILAKECLVSEGEEDAGVGSEGIRRKAHLLDKPIVVVGAGAAAAVGLASLSHLAPVSTAMKVLTFKVPTIIKLSMLQTKKGAAVAMTKLLTPLTKLVVPAAKGFGPAKFTLGSKISVLKAASSTGKIRAAAHSVVATAEKASLSLIRTAFYNVMQNRRQKSAGGRSWLSFGGSIAVCVGLLTFGNGIENVIETIPEAPRIARLGRGVNSLYHASETLKQAENGQYWDNLYQKLHGLSNRKD